MNYPSCAKLLHSMNNNTDQHPVAELPAVITADPQFS